MNLRQPAATATSASSALAKQRALPLCWPQMTSEIPEALLNFCILISSAAKYLSLTSHTGQSDTCQSQEQGQINVPPPTVSQKWVASDRVSNQQLEYIVKVCNAFLGFPFSQGNLQQLLSFYAVIEHVFCWFPS